MILAPAGDAQPREKNPSRTILAVGAHAGDMELSAGAALAAHRARGDRVVLLHLTLGESGHPRVSAEKYGEQKRKEAEAAAAVLGAEVVFGPYKDARVPNDEAARQYVAGVIGEVRPTHVITHWRHSLHKDHEATHAVVRDAVVLAAAEAKVAIRGLYYAENWEDAPEFRPFLYVDVTAALEKWRACVRQYEFVRGGLARFPYFDYYESLARVRGAEAGAPRAVAFEVEPYAKKRVVVSLP